MKNNEELQRRITKAREKLPDKVDAILVTSDINRFYFTDLKYTDSALLITRDSAYSFADFRHDGLLKANVGDVYDVICPAKEGIYGAAFEVCKVNNISSVLYESTSTSIDEYNTIKKSLEGIALVPAHNFFYELRTVKSRLEIARIKKAQKLTDDAFNYILPRLDGKITEKEVALKLEFYMRKRGALGVSFDYICVSGAESSMPHGQGQNRPLQKGFFTMDFGCIVNGYLSDMTRTVCIGEPTDEMKKVYNTVLEAHLRVEEKIHAGMTGREADKIARDVIENAGYGNYFGHALGHGVGLEIHEKPNLSPRNDAVLPVGSVVTNEPGIYIPEKFGVRIENMLALTEKGCENLTGAPRELIII